MPVVSTADPDWVEQVHTAAGGRPIPVALDPVGGTAARGLLSALSPGGTLIIYGELAQEPIPLHAATVLHSALGITRADDQSVAYGRISRATRLRLASAVMITTDLPHHFDVAATYPLERIADAVRHVSQPGKVGTVVVKP